ncbi:MAG TPA: preprotein translocase subunit YajC [Gammaproteobacteria bacterium]|nr:preprotein translocase subunit YajC [Gammaproteobacteria bacterium]
MDFFISPAWADASAEAAAPGMIDFLFPVIILVLFYLILVRPQSKRAKEHKAMQSAIAKGDEVVTDGGLMGKVVDIGEHAILIQFADNLEMKVRRESISSVLPKGTLKKL